MLGAKFHTKKNIPTVSNYINITHIYRKLLSETGGIGGKPSYFISNKFTTHSASVNRINIEEAVSKIRTARK